MRRFLIATSAISLATCGQSGVIDPGMWSTEVSLSAGKSELWSTKVERCMDPVANNEDPVTGILRTTPLGQCTAVESDYEGGKVSVLVHCMGRPGAMIGGMPESRVRMNGTYSGTAMNGPLTVELVHEPESPKLTGILSARRTGDC